VRIRIASATGITEKKRLMGSSRAGTP